MTTFRSDEGRKNARERFASYGLPIAAEPSAKPEATGRRYGAWTIVKATSPNGRRCLAACDCGSLREMATEALESGASLGCGGCKFTPRPRGPTKASDRAAELAAAELRAARVRQRGGGFD